MSSLNDDFVPVHCFLLQKQLSSDTDTIKTGSGSAETKSVIPHRADLKPRFDERGITL